MQRLLIAPPSPPKKTSAVQYDYKNCGSHARLLSPTHLQVTVWYECWSYQRIATGIEDL